MNMTFTSSACDHIITITLDKARLTGNLVVPSTAQGLVILACGSNSRYNPRNYYSAHLLRRAGFATLLIDLLTAEEVAIDVRAKHFCSDLNLLAHRLVGVTNWLAQAAPTRHLKVGYFGVRASGGAALLAAAQMGAAIGAVICQSGELEQVNAVLANVQSPTLLIVGEQDFPVMAAHQDVLAQLKSEKQLAILPQVTHLFKEPGALEESLRLASLWFQRYLTTSAGQEQVSDGVNLNPPLLVKR
jgi:putative phosphoribosyl transferase